MKSDKSAKDPGTKVGSGSVRSTMDPPFGKRTGGKRKSPRRGGRSR